MPEEPTTSSGDETSDVLVSIDARLQDVAERIGQLLKTVRILVVILAIPIALSVGLGSYGVFMGMRAARESSAERRQNEARLERLREERADRETSETGHAAEDAEDAPDHGHEDGDESHAADGDGR